MKYLILLFLLGISLGLAPAGLADAAATLTPEFQSYLEALPPDESVRLIARLKREVELSPLGNVSPDEAQWIFRYEMDEAEAYRANIEGWFYSEGLGRGGQHLFFQYRWHPSSSGCGFAIGGTSGRSVSHEE